MNVLLFLALKLGLLMWASGPLSCSVAADALFQIQPLLPATDTVHFCLQISNATNSQCLLSGHIGGQNGSSHIRSLALQSWPFARTDFKAFWVKLNYSGRQEDSAAAVTAAVDSSGWQRHLGLRLRVTCAAHYYGWPGCRLVCRARDDLAGHWTCDPQTGRRLCLAGWRGPQCSEPVCRAGCSAEHGHCSRSGPGSCECRPGYGGATCRQPLCFPGCRHGFCLRPWQCLCHPDWGGLLCDEHLNPCQSQPCHNGATCLPSSSSSAVKGSGFRCKCTSRHSFGPLCQFTTSAGSAHSWLQQQLLRHQQEDESLASVSLAALFPALVLLLIVAFVLGSLVRLHVMTRTVETRRNNEKVAGLKVCVIGGKGAATVAPPPLLNNQRCLK